MSDGDGITGEREGRWGVNHGLWLWITFIEHVSAHVDYFITRSNKICHNFLENDWNGSYVFPHPADTKDMIGNKILCF